MLLCNVVFMIWSTRLITFHYFGLHPHTADISLTGLKTNESLSVCQALTPKSAEHGLVEKIVIVLWVGSCRHLALPYDVVYIVTSVSQVHGLEQADVQINHRSTNI